MSGTLATEATRRRLTARQADTVRRLTEAGVEEVRESGYENLSIRDVARRAGVAPATAYTYFGSKDHLLAEIFWRRLSALPPVAEGDDTTGRKAGVIAVLRELALLVSEEPELAAGCTAAMFGSEPDVRQLRLYSASRFTTASSPPPAAAARRDGCWSWRSSAPWWRPASATRRTSTWPTDSPRPPS